MPIFSLKMPKDLETRLRAAARRRRTTRATVVRDALEAYLHRADGVAEGSFVDLAGDLVGCVEGPGDLSYDPKRLRGYGR